MTLEELLRQVLGPAGALVILAVAVYYLLNALAKANESRFKLLEDQSRRCSEDRVETRKELLSLQTEVRELYKAMLKSTRTEVSTVQQFADSHMTLPE